MTWTGRSEDVACCDGRCGPVTASEIIARHMHSGNCSPDIALFQRKELTGEGLPWPLSNDCGEADGCSVDRVTQLSDDQIKVRSQTQSDKVAGRSCMGSLVASVSELRSISGSDPDLQLVYVYDDPKADNDEHAVIRVSQGLPRPDFKDIQRKIVNCFSGRVA